MKSLNCDTIYGEDETNCLQQERPSLQDITLFSTDIYEEKLFSIFEREISQKLELKTFVTFSGGISRGKMQGPGSFIYEDGSFYVGNFYEGIRDGHGILFY
jgi:MORN repeat